MQTFTELQEQVEVFAQLVTLLPLAAVTIAVLGVVAIGTFTIKVTKAITRR
jgi:hypothetical protein